MNTNIELYKHFVENVRELESSWKIANKYLNNSLCRNNQQEIIYCTRTALFIHATLAEALFYKTIYTPCGLSTSEINQICSTVKRNGINEGWIKCIDLSLRRIKKTDKGTYANIQKKLKQYVKEFIEEPIHIRNKIAHGQWKKCLNNECNNYNEVVTKQLAELDIIQIDRWKNGFKILSDIIEIMIESPKKHFHHILYEKIAEYEKTLAYKKNWTIESKIKKLKMKKTYYQVNTEEVDE